VKQRRNCAKDCIARRRRVIVQNRAVRRCRHSTGMDARKRGWSSGRTKEKRASKSLTADSSQSTEPTPDSPASCRAWVLGRAHAHTRLPSLQMHMWVRLPVIPQRAAPGADLGAAYLICSMTSVTRRAGGVALVGLTSSPSCCSPLAGGRLLALSPL
jgi:hypothetical protein